ncbi:hypothetical protein AB6A40_000760 [Gnathostoma spinigerum]|uniref:Uncharacterized protein n=1 Tax=Gnathostoma spinigerum TaxID=75299 RepID=A0ABD6E9I5_9BILA
MYSLIFLPLLLSLLPCLVFEKLEDCAADLTTNFAIKKRKKELMLCDADTLKTHLGVNRTEIENAWKEFEKLTEQYQELVVQCSSSHRQRRDNGVKGEPEERRRPCPCSKSPLRSKVIRTPRCHCFEHHSHHRGEQLTNGNHRWKGMRRLHRHRHQRYDESDSAIGILTGTENKTHSDDQNETLSAELEESGINIEPRKIGCCKGGRHWHRCHHQHSCHHQNRSHEKVHGNSGYEDDEEGKQEERNHSRLKFKRHDHGSNDDINDEEEIPEAHDRSKQTRGTRSSSCLTVSTAEADRLLKKFSQLCNIHTICDRRELHNSDENAERISHQRQRKYRNYVSTVNRAFGIIH